MSKKLNIPLNACVRILWVGRNGRYGWEVSQNLSVLAASITLRCEIYIYIPTIFIEKIICG